MKRLAFVKRNGGWALTQKSLPPYRRGDKRLLAGAAMLEMIAYIVLFGLIVTAFVVAIFKLVAFGRTMVAKSDLSVIEEAIVMMNMHTHIRPGWRSCPNTGGTGIVDLKVNYLSTIPATLVDSTSALLTAGGNTEEDFDNHFNYKCGSAAATQGANQGYDSAGGTWQGEYLKEINKRDPWGYPYFIMVGAYTNASPTLVCTAGGDNKVVTPYGATTATSPNICITVVLQ